MDYQEIIDQLKALANPDAVAGIKHFGIRPGVEIYGISIPNVRKLAKQIGKDHATAERLWESGIHEGRILATLVAEPRKMTEAQMDRWANAFDSWDVCDQCCSNLFVKLPWAYQKVVEWSANEKEFVKRAAFALIAYLAVHDKKAQDSQFEALLPIIEREAGDARNFVKKAVDWALRQIGKRNAALNRLAIQSSERLEKSEAAAARWVAKDALRELKGEAVQNRLK